ncbi:MAG: hypothetical protein EPN39_16780 [Chitinophagaceae bacterium]|nr:MAG: hypothetical protein EPN39_16780 [Chitinophagaceae bacterium]
MRKTLFLFACLLAVHYSWSQTYSLAPSSGQNGFAVYDTRSTVYEPQDKNMGVYGDFKLNTTDGLTDGGTYNGVITFRQYGIGTDFSGGLSHELGFTDNNNIWLRSGSFASWGTWTELWSSGNLNKSNFINKENQNYYQANTWLQFNGNNYGLYFPESGSGIHLAPNFISSYGSFQIDGSKNGYTGILFGATNAETTPNIMFDGNGNGGVDYQGNIWGFYYDLTNNYLAIGGTNNAATGSLYAGGAIFNNNVLIGKTSQTNTSYKLDVNGNIRADQVTVNATGADYVFDSTYHLPPINSLSKYINKYHHLPGVSSAQQMKKDGLSIGDTEMQLLQKMEEMTLYMIKMNKKLQAVEMQVNGLKSMNKHLNTEIKKLKAGEK